jgi:hypothetical protein
VAAPRPRTAWAPASLLVLISAATAAGVQAAPVRSNGRDVAGILDKGRSVGGDGLDPTPAANVLLFYSVLNPRGSLPPSGRSTSPTTGAR